MEEQIVELINSKNKLFLKNKKYILEHDWSASETKKPKRRKKVDADIIDEEIDKASISYKKGEFKMQNDVVIGMLQHLSRFLKKIKGVDVSDETQKFLDDSLEVIEIHTNRVDFYIDNIDISEIEIDNVRADELKFHNEISREVELVQDKIALLGLRNSKVADTSAITFRDDVKAPLSMHWILSELYPEIKKKLEEKGVDIDNPPLNNEMLIYMEDVPVWDTKLHYWEQKIETLKFYASEFYKLKNGIRIDDIYISGWAYYHINIFKANIPKKVWNETQKKFVSKDNIMSPPLRDSDYMIFENRALQESTNTLFSFLAATRRAAKSTAESSMLAHATTIGLKELLCAGASDKDLGQVAKGFKVDLQNKNPAFAVYNVTNDWSKKIEVGIKKRDGQTILLSTLNIINTDDGNNKEIFAGFTPDLMVYDEVMKAKFLETLEGLLPAMAGDDGTIRCFGILSGTGGSDALSADGLKALNDPETYEILPMQWDILERGIPEHLITWQEDRQKSFGTFIPGQCRVDMPKIESTLADYLGKPESEELRKIKIKITDWEKANKIIEDRREKVAKDKIKLNKEIIYCPLKPSEIFMSGKINRFPVAEAKAHKRYLLETGLWDRRRDLYRDMDGKIKAMVSDKPLAEFPHKGSFIDAPFLIFEDLPKEKPKFGLYTGGFDDYASEDSDSKSVSTFYVKKNTVIGDKFSDKIVASISFRPEKHPIVWEKWLLLMEAYNLDQTAFGENFNYEIKTFLDKKKLADKYLAPSIAFTDNFSLPNNGKRTTGWNPQTLKKFLFDLFVDECNETYEIPQEDGTTKVLKGVQLIDDIWLLEEIIQWSENLNVDRITAAMGCYGYAHYLRSSFKWKTQFYKGELQQKPQLPKEQLQKKPMFFNPNKKTFFRGQR
jgi:hypothetical protein